MGSHESAAAQTRRCQSEHTASIPSSNAFAADSDHRAIGGEQSQAQCGEYADADGHAVAAHCACINYNDDTADGAPLADDVIESHGSADSRSSAFAAHHVAVGAPLRR